MDNGMRIIMENGRILAPNRNGSQSLPIWLQMSRQQQLARPTAFHTYPDPFSSLSRSLPTSASKAYQTAKIHLPPAPWPTFPSIPFFQQSSIFYFLQFFLCIIYRFFPSQQFPPQLFTSCPPPVPPPPFPPLSPSRVILLPGAVQIKSGLFIGSQQQQMFSSGGRAPSSRQDAKAPSHRNECDNHTALNAHKQEGRGNRHMGSPFKHSTPGQTHSKSRQKKLSANKLFSKAHQTSDHETYLTSCKSGEPYHPRQLRSNSGPYSDCLHTKKAKVLQMCQQFNIKIGGELDNNTLSLIIQKYGNYGITIDDLSSIQQNSDDSTLTSANTSLIDLIVKS